MLVCNVFFFRFLDFIDNRNPKFGINVQVRSSFACKDAPSMYPVLVCFTVSELCPILSFRTIFEASDHSSFLSLVLLNL